MKIIFNDATELVVQSASIRVDGSLLIKTISATEEELRTMFQDKFKTQKMTVTERESTIAEYENYTDLNAVVKYTAGILGVVMYREKESQMDRIDALEEHVDNLTEANKSQEAECAELIATVDSILTDVLPALLGDGAEETDTEANLKNMFQDQTKTKKMTVTERESTLGEYENYTNLNALVKYIGGILGVVIYREKESPMDRIDALEEHVDNLTEANKSREAESAELIATVDSILTDVLPALLGDGTEETQ